MHVAHRGGRVELDVTVPVIVPATEALAGTDVAAKAASSASVAGMTSPVEILMTDPFDGGDAPHAKVTRMREDPRISQCPPIEAPTRATFPPNAGRRPQSPRESWWDGGDGYGTVVRSAC